MQDVTVTSTTDSQDEVAKATGDFKVESVEVETPAQAESTPAETIAASEASETEETKDAKDPGEKKEKKKGGFQRRIDRATREREEARRDAEFWKAKALETSKSSGEAKVDAKAVDSSKEPLADQFEKHEDYVKALAKWEVRQELNSEKAKVREDAVKEQVKTAKQKHIERVTEFTKANPDFNDAMEEIKDMRLQASIHTSIVESDFGPQLMYEFAKKPEELERINALSPEAAARAIGRLEAKFESTSSVTKTETEKKITTAPKPITPVSSKAGHTKSIRDELPYDEWATIRRAELRNR